MTQGSRGLLRAGQLLNLGGRWEVATDDWLQPDVGGGPPDGVNELDHKSVDVCIAMYLYCICTANQSIFVKAQKAGSVWRQSSPADMQCNDPTHLLHTTHITLHIFYASLAHL